ncbi:MAG: hypothetical protein JRH20_06745 [Deltaproteobacteria bacterium]|nr:hypothetical protein [Deltaproteobacteria bacterium]
MAWTADRFFWIVIVLLTGVVTLVFVQLRPATPIATAMAASHGRSAIKRAPPKKKTSHFSLRAQRKRRLIFSQVSGDQAFTRLGEPYPGDWLFSFQEPGQTIHEYGWQRPNHPIPEQRETLHLLPFDDLHSSQRALIAPLRRHTALFFGVKVAVLPKRQVLGRFYDKDRQQYDADRIVRHLAQKVPINSLGIYSLARFGKERGPLLKRALKLSAHEIGHMFGLKHCVFYECVMNGVNSRAEMDRSPLHLCPVCLSKLQWNVKFDAVQRYRGLARFYREEGLEQEAAFAEARAVELGG